MRCHTKTFIIFPVFNFGKYYVRRIVLKSYYTQVLYYGSYYIGKYSRVVAEIIAFYNFFINNLFILIILSWYVMFVIPSKSVDTGKITDEEKT